MHPGTEIWFDRHEVLLGEVPVRILRPEILARVVAIHFLRHGGQRPLWMCDRAMLWEKGAADWDMELFLGDDRVLRSWVMCAVQLAHEFVGADLKAGKAAGISGTPPDWATKEVAHQWLNPSHS